MPARIVSRKAQEDGRADCYVKVEGSEVSLVPEGEATEWERERGMPGWPTEVDSVLARLKDRYGLDAGFDVEEWTVVREPPDDTPGQREALKGLLE